MGISVEITTEPRTFLDAVTKVLTGTGNPEPGTLAGAARHVLRAMEACRDALEEVWYAAEWNWRIGFFRMELAENKMWYDLPDDFSAIIDPVPLFDGLAALTVIDYQELVKLYPKLRFYPNDSGVIDLSLTVQAATLTDYIGSPTRYVIVGDNIGLFKLPDADFVTANTPIIPGYLKTAPQLEADSDQLQIPNALYRAHHKLSLGFYKQYAEQSDYAVDLKIGQEMLAAEVARFRRRTRSSTLSGRPGRDRD